MKYRMYLYLAAFFSFILIGCQNTEVNKTRSSNSSAVDYYYGLAIDKNTKTGLFGFVNKSKKLVIPHQYTSVTDFSYGVSVVTNNTETFIINTQGEKIISNVYDNIQIVDTVYAITKKYNKYGLFDYRNDKEIIANYLIKIKSGKFGLFFAETDDVVFDKILYDSKYNHLYQTEIQHIDTIFKKYMALRRNNGSISNIINRETFKIVGFDDVQIFADGNEYLFIDSKNTVYNSDLSYLSQFQKFDEIIDYGDGLFAVKVHHPVSNNLIGFVDINGDYQIYPFFQSVKKMFNSDYAVVELGDNVFIKINKKGETNGDYPSENWLKHFIRKKYYIRNTKNQTAYDEFITKKILSGDFGFHIEDYNDLINKSSAAFKRKQYKSVIHQLNNFWQMFSEDEQIITLLGYSFFYTDKYGISKLFLLRYTDFFKDKPQFKIIYRKFVGVEYGYYCPPALYGVGPDEVIWNIRDVKRNSRIIRGHPLWPARDRLNRYREHPFDYELKFYYE